MIHLFPQVYSRNDHLLAIGVAPAGVGAVVDGGHVLDGLADDVGVDGRRGPEDERPHVAVQALAGLDPGPRVTRVLRGRRPDEDQQREAQRGPRQPRHFHSLRYLK